MKKKQKKPIVIDAPPKMTPLISWCDRVITIGFYLLFGLIPFLLTPFNYELFEFNKMIGVYAVTSFIVTSWVVKMIAKKEIRIARTPLDIPIALFVASQFVSSLFSIDPHISWFGYYSRFNGGMWSVICYVVLYYAYMSNPPNGEVSRSRLLKATLISAMLVAFYGVLERFGIDKNLWVQDVQNRVFSTLGQPNWLAAYLVALIPLSLALAIQKTKHIILSIFYSLLTLLLFTTLLFTKSRSGLLGFAVADFIFWGIYFIRPSLAETLSTSSRGKGKAFFALHILFALIIFFTGTGTPAIDKYMTITGIKKLLNNKIIEQSNKPSIPSGPALEVGGTESGTIRKYVWQGAINAWKSTTKTLLIGTGTETFALAFYQFRPVGHNDTSEWDFLYNKAHNEYLNYLATTGIFGLGSYLLFIGTFIWWFLKKFLNPKYLNSNQILSTKSQLGQLDQLEIGSIRIISLALFAGWISILITNFFGFSVVITQVFLFLFPAIIFSLDSKNQHSKQYQIPSIPWAALIVTTLSLILIYAICIYWYADTLFATGYRLNRAGQYAKAMPYLRTAIKVSSKEPSYHDELAQSYAPLAVGFYENNNASQAAQIAQLAIHESDLALRQSPRNVNLYKTRTKVFYTLSMINPDYMEEALKALTTAATLSPNDPKILYNIAILMGRINESKEAIAILNKAKSLKPNYRDVYYALHVFYLDANKANEAKAILTEYLTKVDPNDADFQKRIQQ